MKRLIILGACVSIGTMAFAAADAGGGGGSSPVLLSLPAAISALDPALDGDWTQAGEPAMSRIQELTGKPDLKRADVEAAQPNGFNRANANAAPTVKDDNNGSQASTETPSTNSEAFNDALGGGDGSKGNEAVSRMGMNGELSPSAQAVAQILEKCFDGENFDAVALLEAAASAAQSDRFRRNNALQNLVRGYQVTQLEIKEVQGRLDARISDRAAKNAASREQTAKDQLG